MGALGLILATKCVLLPTWVSLGILATLVLIGGFIVAAFMAWLGGAE